MHYLIQKNAGGGGERIRTLPNLIKEKAQEEKPGSEALDGTMPVSVARGTEKEGRRHPQPTVTPANHTPETTGHQATPPLTRGPLEGKANL